MAASMARRSRYLRDFAASLSHEFKTPLAGLRGGIELLQDHGESMTGEERDRFLTNIAGDAERLSRLISRLIELAKPTCASAKWRNLSTSRRCSRGWLMGWPVMASRSELRDSEA